MAWGNRFANLFRAAKVRDEIDEELRYHLDARRVDNLAAGMSEKEARADALRRFGGATAALDRAHDANVFVWIDAVLQDLRYGLRSLRSNPGVAAVAALSLALATGAGTAIFSVVDAVLLRTLPYREPDRIALLWMTNTLNGSSEINLSIPNFEDWKRQSHSFSEWASYRYVDASFTVNGEPDWVDFAFVYGDFFRLMGRSPVLGRVLSAEDENARGVVLSNRLWRSRFGASLGVLGRTIRLSGVDVQVIGVMPEDFAFPSKDVQLWAAPGVQPNWSAWRGNRLSGFGPAIGRLRPGIALEQARAEMGAITHRMRAEYPEEDGERGVRVAPLAAEIHGKTVPFMLAMLSATVLLVLLIACANAANLLLARGAARRREIALRTALGAGRGRVLRQLITEGLLLSMLAGLLGLPFAAWSIRMLVALAPQGIARLDEAHIDATVLIFSLCLSLATGLLFGIAPAIRISREAVSHRHTGGVESQGLRRVFVAAQVALAVVLLTGAGLLIRSFAAVEAVDPGFRSSHALSATLRFQNTLPRERRAALYRDAMKRIGELQGVSAAGAVSQMFFRMDNDYKFGLRAVEGHPPESRQQWAPMAWETISGDYFQALGIPLLRGRFFTERDTPNTTPVVIINQTMARRYWPHEDPIGKGLKGFDARGHNDEWVRVIGVVKDMHSRGLEHLPAAQIYEAQAQSLDETENVVVRTDLSAGVLRGAVRSVDSTAVWTDVATLEQRLQDLSAPRRFQTLLLSLLAALALALTGSGVFAVMHYSVAQRTQEIGIRMALGARPATVIRMVLIEALALIGVGGAVGFAGAAVLTRSIRSLLFEVAPTDPATLVTVAALLAAIAVLACYAPARRATRVDPILALRCD